MIMGIPLFMLNFEARVDVEFEEFSSIVDHPYASGAMISFD